MKHPLRRFLGSAPKLAIALACLLAPPAFAQWLTGTVTGLIPFSDSPDPGSGAEANPVLLFKLNTNTEENCNTAGRFAISSASPRYRGTLAAIIAAYHAQTPIRVRYSLACTANSISYDALYVCSGVC